MDGRCRLTGRRWATQPRCGRCERRSSWRATPRGLGAEQQTTLDASLAALRSQLAADAIAAYIAEHHVDPAKLAVIAKLEDRSRGERVKHLQDDKLALSREPGSFEP